jgi:small-conductance mechanosensitive channel
LEVLQYGDRVQLGGIKGDVMDIGVLRTTIMETGQWVDGDLYNGRIDIDTVMF